MVAAMVVVLCLACFLSAGRVLVATGTIPSHADAVIVVANYNHGERLAAGIEAMSASGAGRMVVLLDQNAPVVERNQVTADLARRHWSLDRARLVAGGYSTVDQARISAGLVRRCKWRTVVVVTSTWNTHRAAVLFSRAIDGSAASVKVTGTAEPFHPWTWWAHSEDRQSVLYEWPRLIVQAARYSVSAPSPRDPGAVPC